MSKDRKLFPRILRTASMMVCFSAGALFPGSAASQAQLPPQETPSPATRPEQPGPRPPNSRMTPTGLSANGGAIAHDVYTNSIYDFSMKLPPGWVVVPPQAGSEVNLQGTDPELAKQAQTNRILLLMTENLPMKKNFQRKSIQVIATRMISPQTGSAQDYLIFSQKTAKEKQMAIEYPSAPEEVTINGQKLWWNKMKMNTGGGPQVANQYVVMQGPYLLQFFLVSPDEDGLKSLQPTIQSLDIKPMPVPKSEVPKKAPVHRARKKPVPQAAPAQPTKPTQ
jgi:hypothetical protein